MLISLLASSKRGIDILQQNEATLGRIDKQMIELVICKTALRQVEDADIVVKRASQGLYKRRFA